MISIKEKYKKEVLPQMMKKFGYKNPMAVPCIKKVTINSSFGKTAVTKTGAEREKLINLVSQDLALITGQKAKIAKSKKSIAGFKLREGLEIAEFITLRKQRMWDFLERFIHLVLPRTRDFKGLNPMSVDQKGNFTVGFKENVAFPEIFTEKEKTIFGLEITITTNAKNKEEGLELYKLMGFPMKEGK